MLEYKIVKIPLAEQSPGMLLVRSPRVMDGLSPLPPPPICVEELTPGDLSEDRACK